MIWLNSNAWPPLTLTLSPLREERNGEREFLSHVAQQFPLPVTHRNGEREFLSHVAHRFPLRVIHAGTEFLRHVAHQFPLPVLHGERVRVRGGHKLQ